MLSLSFLLKTEPFIKTNSILFFRKGHTLRGKRPGIARSLEQRILEDQQKSNLSLLPRINIGFACKTSSRSETLKNRIIHIKNIRNDPEMEKLSRNHSLLIDLKEVEKESETTTSSFFIKNIADHYGVYNDLFDNAFFVPRVNLKIYYTDINHLNHPVFYGNLLKPSCTTNAPKIIFENNKKLLIKENDCETSYWTILMVNPDTHLFDEKYETCLNWLITNIHNNEIETGEEIVKYLQPFPVKGFGFQRNIFILFKQTEKIDFGDIKTKNWENLGDRKFNLLQFYRIYQDVITPAGLSFFQSEWDESVSNFFRKMNIKEPVFTYDFPKPYLSDQKWFPLKQPFNLYMDKHRKDPSKINKDYLRSHLFKNLDFPIKYPMAHAIKGVPSWMIAEIKKERLKLLQKKVQI